MPKHCCGSRRNASGLRIDRLATLPTGITPPPASVKPTAQKAVRQAAQVAPSASSTGVTRPPPHPRIPAAWAGELTAGLALGAPRAGCPSSVFRPPSSVLRPSSPHPHIPAAWVGELTAGLALGAPRAGCPSSVLCPPSCARQRPVREWRHHGRTPPPRSRYVRPR